MKTDTQTLIDALRILARDIESGDGVANACIAEAADRLEEHIKQLAFYADQKAKLLEALEILLVPAEFADGQCSPPGYYRPAIEFARALEIAARGKEAA